MKSLTLTALIILSLCLSQTYADTNTTNSIKKKTEVKYQDKLKESLTALETDLKNSKVENNITIASDYNKVGFYYNKTKQTENALKYYLKAVKIVEDQKKPYSQKKTIYYNNVASSYEKLNKLPEALQYYNKALTIYKEKLPEDHPYIAGTSSDIGNVYEKMGKMDKALEYQLEALKIRKKSLNPENHPDIIYSYEKVASLYEEKGELNEVLIYGRKLESLIAITDENTSIKLKIKLDKIQEQIASQKTDKNKK